MTSPTESPKKINWACWAVVSAAFIGLWGAQLRLVNRYAVNVMYWDQWDMYLTFFHRKYWWSIFTFQDGPQLQGVGLLVTRVLMGLSHWNTRWEAFGFSCANAGSAVLAMGLVRRCTTLPILPLVIIPFLCFNVHNYEEIVGPQYLSHSAIPVLLILGTCHVVLIRRAEVRVLALAGAVFLMAFSGFAWVAAVVASVMLVWDAGALIRQPSLPRKLAGGLSLAGAAAAWITFSRYLDPRLTASPPVHFHLGDSGKYLEFAALMVAHFYGLPPGAAISVTVGAALLVTIGAIAAVNSLKYLRSPESRASLPAVLLLLAGFTVAYCVATAIGRLDQGILLGPTAGRYMTLLIPAALVLVLLGSRLSGAVARGYYALFFCLIVPATTILAQYERDHFDWFVKGRIAWKAAYLATQDEKKADTISHFQIYPGSVADRLEFLRRRRLNLFLDSPPLPPAQ